MYLKNPFVGLMYQISNLIGILNSEINLFIISKIRTKLWVEKLSFYVKQDLLKRTTASQIDWWINNEFRLL